MNLLAIKVMAEAGGDISIQQSKLVGDLKGIKFAYAIAVCGHVHERCPLLPGKVKIVHVGFDDPPRQSAGALTVESRIAPNRRVREEIRAFVESLPGSLDHVYEITRNAAESAA